MCGDAVVMRASEGSHKTHDKEKWLPSKAPLVKMESDVDGSRDASTGKIVFPHEVVCEMVEILDIHSLARLKAEMMEGHRKFKKGNRMEELQKFVETLKDDRVKQRLQQAMEIKEDDIRTQMHEPVYEALRVFDVAGIPSDGANVFTTTATANSTFDSGPAVALQILQVPNIHVHCFGTVDETGLTGVGGHRPKNDFIRYTRGAEWGQWELLSEGLYSQMMKKSNGGKYDNIYHWGCISQNWQDDGLGHQVSSWMLHEEWNIVYTIAMLRHGVETLKPGGQLCLKVRIFKRAETLGIVALAAPAFDGEIQFVDNPRQNCTFVTVVFNNRASDAQKVQDVMTSLKDATSQSPHAIFTSVSWIKYPESRDLMIRCEKHRNNMILKKAQLNTIFMECLDAFTKGNWPEKLQNDIRECYGEYFCKRWMDLHLENDDRAILSRVMKGEWMKANYASTSRA